MRSLSRERRGRAGAALLEVVVALALLATAGVTLLASSIQSSSAMRHLVDGGRELRAANAFMESIALWSRADLDRHLGVRREGPFVLTVARPTPTLYAIALAEPTPSGAAGRVLLETTLFREGVER